MSIYELLKSGRSVAYAGYEKHWYVVTVKTDEKWRFEYFHIVRRGVKNGKNLSKRMVCDLDIQNFANGLEKDPYSHAHEYLEETE